MTLKNLFQPREDDERLERNTQLLENAQELPIKIGSARTKKRNHWYWKSRAGLEELKQKFIETKLSKLVVYENNIDHIIGYVHQLDLFKTRRVSVRYYCPFQLFRKAWVPVTSSASLPGKEKYCLGGGWIMAPPVSSPWKMCWRELFGEIQDEYDTEEFVEKQLSEKRVYVLRPARTGLSQKKIRVWFGEEESETSPVISSTTMPKDPLPERTDHYRRLWVRHHEMSDTRIETVKMKS